jgi:hypothetical protein
MATRRAIPRPVGPGPTAEGHVAARDAVRTALAAVRPLVSQSRDGLTLVLLEPRLRSSGRRQALCERSPHDVDTAGIAGRGAGAPVAPSATWWRYDPARVPPMPPCVVADDEAERADVTRAFTLPPGTTGMAVGVFDLIVAMDLFDDPRDLAEAWPRLIDAAVGSWIERRRAVTSGAARPPERRHPDAGALGRLVRRSADALDGASVLAAAGPALCVLIDDPRVGGAALVVDGRPVHVAIRRREQGAARRAEAP